MCDARRCGASIATLGAVARAYANRNRTLVIRTVPRHVYCGTVRERVTGVGWRGAGCGDATLWLRQPRRRRVMSPAARCTLYSILNLNLAILSSLNSQRLSQSQTQHSQLSTLSLDDVSVKEWLVDRHTSIFSRPLSTAVGPVQT